MAKALATLNIPAVSKQMLMDFADMAETTGNFLPRIQLFSSGKCINQGLIKPGHWGIPKAGGEEIDDLGSSIDVLPMAARAKALDISDRDAIITCFDVKDPEFQRIRTADRDSGCMWGPSFLVLLRNDGKLYEIFFSNASGRNEAPNLVPFLPAAKAPPSAATIGTRYIERSTYSWHVPVVKRCSEPINNLPDVALLKKEIEAFMNPPANDVERAEPASKRAR